MIYKLRAIWFIIRGWPVLYRVSIKKGHGTKDLIFHRPKNGKILLEENMLGDFSVINIEEAK